MNGNYIKIFRSLLEWEWWHDPNTCRVFIYMLLKANWSDKEWKGEVIKRGSFVSSIGKVAYDCDITIDQTRTAIKHLRNTKEITTVATSKNTVFTVVNYEKYQSDTKVNTKQDTSEDCLEIPSESQTNPKQIPSKSQQLKNNKNNKNNKYIYSAAVIPFLNKKTGKHFRENNEMTESLLAARISDGFTIDDMLTVINIKSDEWLGTDFEKFLRPKTLFNASHFEEYLNQPRDKACKKNKFNNFNQRSYDWDELEQQLLNPDAESEVKK